MPPSNASPRYTASDPAPLKLVVGQGVQHALLCANSTVFVTLVIFRTGSDEVTTTWAVFASLVVCGLTTILQGVGFLGLGGRAILLHNTAGLFIAVCLSALLAGGPALLATLVVVAAVVQIVLSARLSMLRRILTPTVSGTVMLLLPVVVMPILFRMLNDVPDGHSVTDVSISAGVTILVILGVTFFARNALRLWAPVLGIAAGSIVAASLGLFDTDRLLGSTLLGFPEARWPGFDLTFSADFWTHVPVFCIIAVVLTAKVVSGAVGTQRVSQPAGKAIDYRSVQGASGAEGVGNLLAGVVGTAPNTTFLVSTSVIEFTGVATRTIGIVAGAFFILLALFPKALAVFLAIPAAVIAASVMMTMVMLFVNGIKEVVASGLDVRKSMIVGVSFWTGIAFENQWVFPAFFADFLGGIFSSGMSAGCLTAIALTGLSEIASPKKWRFRCPFRIDELPRINAFLKEFSERYGWSDRTLERLQAAIEETVLTFTQNPRDRSDDDLNTRKLSITAYREDQYATLELITATDEKNLQDRIAVLGEQPTHDDYEAEMSLRLLRSMVDSVAHEQYSNADIITLKVDLRDVAS